VGSVEYTVKIQAVHWTAAIRGSYKAKTVSASLRYRGKWKDGAALLNYFAICRIFLSMLTTALTIFYKKPHLPPPPPAL
jgi:hypothetical protein